MPTIGLHAIRLPSGAATKRLHETANNIYAVVTLCVSPSTVGRMKFSHVAMSLQSLYGTNTFYMGSEMRHCCG